MWLPGSRGVTDLAVWRVQEAVNRYDARLHVGRNEDNGQWCVFIRTRPGGDWPELYPVLGLTEPPHDPRTLDPRDVLNRIWNADTLRRGQEMIDWLEKTQEEYRAKEAKASLEVAEIGAEVMEFAHRLSGTHPETRVYMNGRRRRGYGESW